MHFPWQVQRATSFNERPAGAALDVEEVEEFKRREAAFCSRGKALRRQTNMRLHVGGLRQYRVSAFMVV